MARSLTLDPHADGALRSGLEAGHSGVPLGDRILDRGGS